MPTGPLETTTTEATRFRVGVDVGGTFTDFTVLHADGRVSLWKEDSDPVEPIRPIRQGLQAVADRLALPLETFLSRTELFVHGTTIATNSLIQRSGPRLGLLCTQGFRDVLYLRNGFKPERFNVHIEHPKPLVERYLRIAVRERMDRSGHPMLALDEANVVAAADRFREAGVAAVAVGFIWSVANPAHEYRAAAILAESLPSIPILCSADILPEIREWERISATVLSAYILPSISGYLEQLEALLSSSGYGRGPLIMQINGGCASVREILRRPVNALASGPAAAPAAAAFYARQNNLRNIVAIDMGGTSLDVTLVRDGHVNMSRDIQVEQQPIGVPGVEVLSIGAGGGSIAWVDPGGALRVGPRSAGARPGPAAYGTGGTEPTVTDANVVLGYLDPDAFLGGRRKLDRERAEKAVETKVGRPLNMTTADAAAGIVRIVNANMVDAIRAISVKRGVDIRSYTLVVGGGAGGLHGVELARELGVSDVLIPREAGTFCAFGMTTTDVRYDEMAPYHLLSNAKGLEAVDTLFATLSQDVRNRLAQQGFADSAIKLERSVDARYAGQVHELTVPVPDIRALSDQDVRRVEQSFHDEHQRQFTYARREMPIEFLHWRVTAFGRVPVTEVPISASPRARSVRATGIRHVYDPVTRREISIEAYDATHLVPGATLMGPAVVQADTTTIMIGSQDRLIVAANGGFAVKVAMGTKAMRTM
jgi:N-methylhydantoinase A